MDAATQTKSDCARAFRRCGALSVLLGLRFLATGMLLAQSPPETVGRIEGADISVKGPMSVAFENGQSTTVLSSGSDVTVKSGQARLTLVEGGEIGVCGPAHFTVLKSGGALTLALDYGRVHTLLPHAAPVTIYTPMVVASPIAISEGPRDATAGLQSSGEMCVQATRGAIRLEQQLTGQSLLVPQGGEVTLVGGQMESLHGTREACRCDLLIARDAPQAAPKPPELSVPIPARLAQSSQPAEGEIQPKLAEKPKPVKVEEPVYKVLMPALSFDAKSPVPPPDPSPETMLLVREVRVRPAVVFHGRVEAAETAPAPPAEVSPQAPGAPNGVPETPQKKPAGLGTRIRGFFRRLFSRGPCAGAGCASQRRQEENRGDASRGKSDYMPS